MRRTIVLGAFFALAPFVAFADGGPLFIGIQPPTFQARVIEVLASFGARLTPVANVTCTEDGWPNRELRCGFKLGRAFSVTAFSDSNYKDVKLVRIRASYPRETPITAYLQPASIVVRTLEADMTEADFKSLMNRLGEVEYDFDDHLAVDGRTGRYTFKRNESGYWIFEATPLPQ